MMMLNGWTRPALPWLLALAVAALAPGGALAQYDADLDPGFSVSQTDAEQSLLLDLAGPQGQAIQALLGPESLLYGGVRLAQGMWRELELHRDFGQNVSWVHEYDRETNSAAAGLPPYSPRGEIYLVLGLKPSVRNPEVLRTWLWSFIDDGRNPLVLSTWIATASWMWWCPGASAGWATMPTKPAAWTA
jgi:hypothetical protein